MELILKNDVENLGFKDDVVTVKNGYGRNYLIPQGDAILATTSARKVLAENLKQRAFKEKKIVDDAQKVADQLKGLEIKITAKAASGNKLFGSVTNADLAEAIQKESKVNLDKKFVSILGGNVKVAGPYEATIRLHRAVVVNFPFEVVAEA